MIILGLIITMFNLGLSYIMVTLLLFHIINNLLRAVAKSKKYIKLN